MCWSYLGRCDRNPCASFDDIDNGTTKIFLRKVEEASRLPDIDGLSIPELLFGKDPGAFYPNTFVKIGKFEDDGFTIRSQEMEEGNIIQVLDKVLNTLDYKFLIRNISFKGMNRIETLEYPVPALREMLLNALIHRNYMGAPTQLRAYDNKLTLWNHGTLPEGITVDKLTKPHSSFRPHDTPTLNCSGTSPLQLNKSVSEELAIFPRNPVLAEACFRGGYIDSWGSGIMKIIDSCKMAGLPTPITEENDGGFIVRLFKDRFAEED